MPAPHVSIIGHITKDELLGHLDSTEVANGFANRFLWVCVRRSKVLPEGGRTPEAELQALAERLTSALAFAWDVGEVRRDAAAMALWAEVYADLSDGKPGLFGAVTARAEAQVLRLSLIYALLDCSPLITTDHLTAALAVWDYCEASARYVFRDATGDPTADRIFAALRTDGPKTQNDLIDLFGRNVPAARIDGALETLLRARRVASHKEETSGRPRTVWRAL